MSDAIESTCSGFRAAFHHGELGGYDGVDDWILAALSLREYTVQLMVETHESLHRQLQASSGWGLVTAMCAMLAARGHNPSNLTDAFWRMTEHAQATHECYATTMSAALLGVDPVRRLLADNVTYIAHLERGLALTGESGAPWVLKEAALEATLRCCMSPDSLLTVLDRGFDRFDRRMSSTTHNEPDSRLKAFEEAGGPAGWAEVYADLTAEYGDDIAAMTDLNPDRWVRITSEPKPRPVAAERLSRFHEDILLERCNRHVRDVLASTGCGTLGWGQEDLLIDRFTAAVKAIAPDLAARLNIRTERISSIADPAEFDRQKIQLRQPLDVDVVPESDTMGVVDSFTITTDRDGGTAILAVWLTRQTATRQFRFPAGTDVPEMVVALMIGMRMPGDARTVRLGMLPPTTTPEQLREVIGDRRLSILTTQETLTWSGLERVLRGDSVCVLLDGRVVGILGEWLDRRDVELKYVIDRVTAPGLGEFRVVVFATDQLPGFRMVALCGAYAGAMLLGHLKMIYAKSIIRSRELAYDESTAVAIAAVLDNWSTLGNTGWH